MDKRIKEIILSESQIDSKLTELSIDISDYYKDKDMPIMLGILNGCAVFYGQLLTRLPFTLETDFLRPIKNEDGSLGLSFSMDLSEIKNRNFLVVEDILDTGDTLSLIKKTLEANGAKDVKTVVMIDKTSSRVEEFIADWVAHTTNTNDWLAGFGTDFTNDLVHLNHIVSIKKSNE